MIDPVPVLVVATAGAALFSDLRWRSIPNRLTLAAALAGLLIHTIRLGWTGAGTALLGCLAGAAVFALFYLAGGMGAGDVKLMAALGSLLGAADILLAALFAALAGGAHAAAVLAWRRCCGRPSARISIPYAPAIALGAVLALVGRL